MAVLRNIPLNNYATGTLTLTQYNIPDDASSITMFLARCTTATPTIWPNTSTTINVSLEVSLDGGTSWIPGGGFTESGGIRNGKTGAELQQSAGFFTYPAGTNRLGRGTVVIAGGPLRTSGHIDSN